jgi:hypothetical protein
VQKRIVPLIVASEAKRGFAEDKMEQVSVDGCDKMYICLSNYALGQPHTLLPNYPLYQ